ncbi:arsenosugar biosynthesis radical SAM (seleno)protein ArsS [Tautonia plasticadhaerens]|uniref:Molybdenum cofactor biosynthesis protein A n=1 Tax=Tautonia plasticadhaerens TaxID=2527974 RepID=A0A518H2W3_9BACT|nr:arsenosugar biosynthesis radical SAM (seleno)protein ArsS [Tautonia plasticadhaerens]QDV35177.1 molybdenum cofactor biosynthesis protein A [Tautonia plasticadhaerens]
MPRSLLGQGHPLAALDEQLRVLRPSGRFRPFERSLGSHGLDPLTATGIGVLQLNLGKMCNQTCKHCHVDAGPDRTEIMTRETMEHCLRALGSTDIPRVDLTGGAPELNPHFRWLVERIRDLGRSVMDRCNLTILMVPRFRDLPEFLAGHRVEVVASLPYFLARNTDAQRGVGVFEDSIAAIRLLNGLGYGVEGSGLTLNLVSNPTGAFLPPRQGSIEADFRRELKARYDVVFNHLYVITNMPINRFLEFLLRTGQYEAYMDRLVSAYNPVAAEAVMCRTTLSVGWDGRLYDCDFNQQLDLTTGPGLPRHVAEFDAEALARRPIVTGLHCYGCTAGAGSSCGGEVAR